MTDGLVQHAASARPAGLFGGRELRPAARSCIGNLGSVADSARSGREAGEDAAQGW